MRLYLDSSALVKLVQRETESDALRRFLRRHRADQLVTSALARVEVVRAVLIGGPAALAQARRQLSRLDQILQPRRSSERSYGLSSLTTVGWRTPLRTLALRSRVRDEPDRARWRA